MDLVRPQRIDRHGSDHGGINAARKTEDRLRVLRRGEIVADTAHDGAEAFRVEIGSDRTARDVACRRRRGVRRNTRLFEARARGDHAPIGRHQPRTAVEHEIVLPADGVHARDERARLTRTLGKQRDMPRILPRHERTRAQDGDHRRALRLRVGDGIARVAALVARVARLPEILAEQDGHALARVLDHRRPLARLEVAVLVEHVVARKQLLGRKALDAPAAEQRDGVVERAIGRARRKPDEDEHRLGNLAREALGEPQAMLGHALPQQQVARRVAKKRQLRTHDELRARLPRHPNRVEVRTQRVARTDRGAELGEDDLQAGSFSGPRPAPPPGFGGYPPLPRPDARIPSAAASGQSTIVAAARPIGHASCPVNPS